MKLFDFELAWASAAFDAVLPEHPALPHGLARLAPAHTFAEMVTASAFEQAVGLRLMLWLVALAPLWLLRRPRTIAGVGARDRQRVLELLLASSSYVVRQLALAFKATASMLYARSPEARQAMTSSTMTSLVRLRVREPSVAGGSSDSAAE